MVHGDYSVRGELFVTMSEMRAGYYLMSIEFTGDYISEDRIVTCEELLLKEANVMVTYMQNIQTLYHAICYKIVL